MEFRKRYSATYLIGFRSRKAAQLAAYFLSLSKGHMEKLKLTKLLYLVERESISARGRPMLYDEYYSLKDGPIPSSSLNGINGEIDEKIWGQYLHLENARSVKLARDFAAKDMDELSKSDLRVARAVWEGFGWMSSGQIRNYTHKNCEEYTEVKKGRVPITYEGLARALNSGDPEELGRHVNEYRSLEASLSK